MEVFLILTSICLVFWIFFWEAPNAAKKKALQDNQEEQRVAQIRDADTQSEYFIYRTDKHANEALAIRYGIANTEDKMRGYIYHGPGGVKMRNEEEDTIIKKPANSISLKKTKLVRENLYAVKLENFGDREALAIIEPGTDYVKTFYPLNNSWFEENEALENCLKDNGTFSLRELAHFHVNALINQKSGM
jgi:hypothetical protein